ncbi:hypothetical protein QE410_003139 [Microbacterium sp. SORGH_AS 1204]|uniref:hypothetical protein n=1 Tax=Microbacterium sp. SORGH_AS_1204 TaxID=3041785 RepID=UPI00278E4238|nr:hypothetical protein [Microbacterium sp. SORGH_AS_1204]MDQ1138340.1 hypothetical protein [Microbacterium sp. SORGH_AS_1204]
MSITNVLQTPRRSTADRAWGELELRDAAAARATTTMLPGAAVLPLTTFLDANVYPVVVWDRRALSLRLSRMDGPAVSTDAVRDLLDAGSPTVLRVAAMIGVGAPTPTRRALRPLRSLARTIGMFPAFPRRSPLVAEEFDAQGTALVACDGTSIEVYVGGDAGVRAGSVLSPLWRRVYEERLFEWAIRSDALPCALPAVESLHPGVE